MFTRFQYFIQCSNCKQIIISGVTCYNRKTNDVQRAVLTLLIGDGYLLSLHVQMPFYGCSDVQTSLSLGLF